MFDGRPVEPVYLITGAVLVAGVPPFFAAGATENNEIRWSLIVAGTITLSLRLAHRLRVLARAQQALPCWLAILAFRARCTVLAAHVPMIALLPPAPEQRRFIRKRVG